MINLSKFFFVPEAFHDVPEVLGSIYYLDFGYLFSLGSSKRDNALPLRKLYLNEISPMKYIVSLLLRFT